MKKLIPPLSKVPLWRLLTKGLLFFLLVLPISLSAQSFSQSNLDFNGNGEVAGGSSLMFGPDGRLYVLSIKGNIDIFTIQRNGPNDYVVLASEELLDVKNIPNHDDDGAFNTGDNREATGLTVAGTAANPVIYVTSSDSRIGGPNGDENLDTNSGVITRLTWNGTFWEVVDLVRGLPRSEENHATNGLEFVTVNGTDFLIVTSGGHTNAGSPSDNFAWTTEYALSAAVLSVNLTMLEAMPILADGARSYIYDLPTLDDPTRANVNGVTDPNNANYNGIDVGDPWGGNDGLNQAMIVLNGPVQVFSPGYRNTYDLVVTESGAVYVTDNGANAGWGGLPENEGMSGTVTNNYLPAEPGSSSATGGEAVNNNDHLTLVTASIGTYVTGSFYGGHPAPIRANPAGAGLFTNPTSNGLGGDVFRTMTYDPDGSTPGSTTDPTVALPANWPPVPLSLANPQEGDWRGPGMTNPDGPDDVLVTTWGANTNGIDEYTASNFGGAMLGDLIAGKNGGILRRVELNPDGSLETLTDDFVSNLGGNALGVTCNSDADPFPGTIWVAPYNANVIVLEPQDFIICILPGEPGYDANGDNDYDGYTNQDEIDNGTDMCNGGSQPNDFDKTAGGVLVSDLNDNDDDDDGIIDSNDSFQFGDPTTSGSDGFLLPVLNDLFSDNPILKGYLGLGFTGLMNNGDPNPNYLNWLDRVDDPSEPNPNDILGGAVGAMTMQMTAGTAEGTANTQEKGFQYGVQVDASTNSFTVEGRLLNFTDPLQLYGSSAPANGELGIFIGDGTQSSFIKVILTQSGVKAYQEVGDVAIGTLSTNVASGNRPNGSATFYLNVDATTGTMIIEYAFDGGPKQQLGSMTAQGAILTAIQQSATPLAVGFTGSSNTTGVELEGTWDYLNVTGAQPTIAQVLPDVAVFVGASPQVINLSSYFGDDQGVAGLTYTVESNTNSANGVSIAGTDLTISFAGATAISDVTIRATDASGLFVDQTFEVSVLDEPEVLFRVNAGGPLVAATDAPNIDWAANEGSGTQTGVGYSVNTGNITTHNNILTLHSSAPAYTPLSLFEKERWDLGNVPEMEWSFATGNGSFIVNLYMADGFAGTSTAGGRVFDINIEGALAIDSMDLSGNYGHQLGVMVSRQVTVADGELNIEFIHVTDNPLINAIEILGIGNGNSPITITSIPARLDKEGDIVNLTVQALGGDSNENFTYSAVDLPTGLQIEPTTGVIFGTIAVGASTQGSFNSVVSVSKPSESPVDMAFTWNVISASAEIVQVGYIENLAAGNPMLLTDTGIKGVSDFATMVNSMIDDDGNAYSITAIQESALLANVAGTLAPYDIVLTGSAIGDYSGTPAQELESWVKAGGTLILYSDLELCCGADNSLGQTSRNSMGIATWAGAQQCLDQKGTVQSRFVPVDNFLAHNMYTREIQGEGLSPFIIDEDTTNHASQGYPTIIIEKPTQSLDKPGGTTFTGTIFELGYSRPGQGLVFFVMDRQGFLNGPGTGTDITEAENRQFAKNLLFAGAGAIEVPGVGVKENLAYLKSTTQSATSHGGVSSRGVDGNTSGVWGQKSVTHTPNSLNPWWRVDLGQEFDLDSIRVFNRTNCCTDRLDGAKVFAGTVDSNDPADFTELGTLADLPSQLIDNPGVTARYIMVYHTATTNKTLSIAELQAYGDTAVAFFVATPGIVTFPSTEVGLSAAAQTVTVSNTGSVAMTVSNVQLQGADATAFSHNATLPMVIAPAASADFQVSFMPTAEGMSAAQVVMTHDATNGPTSSVEVSGEGFVKAENLAYLKSATQSAMSHNGAPSRAVDGNTSGVWGQKSVTHTPNSLNPWWRVDLGQEFDLDSIRVYNRTDCCTNRIDGAKVFAGTVDSSDPADFTELGTLADIQSQLIDNPGVTARYIMVYHTATTNKVLSIAELQAYGDTAVAEIAVSPLALDFGTVTVGSPASSEIVTVSNTGTLPLTVSNVELLGTGAAEFSHNATLPMVIAAGSSSDFQVSFVPTASVVSSAQLTLTHDGVNGPATSIAVSGEGFILVKENLAYLKSTTQSATSHGGVSSRAVDGNTNGVWQNGSITHTPNSLNPWWRVDLGQEFDLDSIRVFNRTNCCTDRLAGAKVFAGTVDSNDPTDFTELGTLADLPSQLIDNPGVTARYIMVYHTATSNKVLSIAELQAFGDTAVAPGVALYRINTGGTQLPAADGSAPDWGVDMPSNPSPYLISGGENTFASGTTITLDASVPASAVMTMFQTERYDQSSESPMTYSFPINLGTQVEVRLYLAELYFGTVGSRVFDVLIEGVTPTGFSQIDMASTYGQNVGAMLSHVVTVTDGTLDIEFGAIANNPAVKGIEIINLGTAPSALSASATSVSFGDNFIGDMATETIQLSNTGGNALTISNIALTGSEAGMFAFDQSAPLQLGPASSITLQVSYLPSALGAANATLELTHNGANASPFQIALSGNGLQSGGIAMALPTAVSFPATFVDSTSSPMMLTLANVGNADMDITGLTISGAHASDYSHDFTSVQTLAPNSSIPIEVTFTPSGLGNRAATITVVHDGVNSSAVTISLNGEGLIPVTASSVTYRVNVGGPAVVATDNSNVDWSSDQNGAGASPYRNNVGNVGGTGFSSIHSSVPSTTPSSLFTSERWDPDSEPELEWDFPVSNGTYEVRLYFMNSFGGTANAGQRVFDVSLEGIVILDDLDISAEFGHQVGGMKSMLVTVNDGSLDIDFTHVVDNPLLNGIEILAVPNSSVAAFTGDETTGVVNKDLFPGYELHQNYPNPFLNETVLEFEVPQSGNVRVGIYNQIGQLVWESNGEYPAGRHAFTWRGTDQDGSELSSGMYHCVMETEHGIVGAIKLLKQ